MMSGQKQNSMLRMKLFIFETVVLLLIINSAHSRNFRELYDQHRKRYINFEAFSREPSTYGDSTYEETAPVQTLSRPSFQQQDASKIQYLRVPSVRSRAIPDNEIVFPDSIVESRITETEAVPACKGTTFCEEVSDYPMHIVNDAIRSDRSLLNYANVDVVEGVSVRVGGGNDNLCVANERVVFPKTAETMKKEWLFVVNHPNFTQGVRIETCESEGERCRMIDGFAAGYTTSCKQKYVYRQLMAFGPNRPMAPEFFRFAATCCCHVEFTGSIVDRAAKTRMLQ